MTILFTTREISYGIIGNLNFRSRVDEEKRFGKKNFELFKAFSREVRNLIYGKEIEDTSINLTELVMDYAVEFMEGQNTFLNTSQTETSKAKRGLLQLVNQKLLDNE
jgi:hypothetical protein